MAINPTRAGTQSKIVVAVTTPAEASQRRQPRGLASQPRKRPRPVEVATYYVVSEALTNMTKHADASYVTVLMEERYGTMRLSVQDDGVGGADPARGSGLVGIRDRVEALGGSFEVTSPVGEGTLIQVALPIESG